MSTTKQIENEIHRHGFHVIDNFLPKVHYQSLCRIIEELHTDGSFQAAKIGQNANTKHLSTIRNDQIYWLDEDMQDPAIQAYFNELNRIKTTLNESLFLGLNNLEAHFAVYKPGSFYKKHVDQFATNLDRRISCVYYLNEHWKPEQGGELMMYNNENQLLTHIEPKGNRLVCFSSDLPHEVKTTHNLRYSIAAWMKVRSIK